MRFRVTSLRCLLLTVMTLAATARAERMADLVVESIDTTALQRECESAHVSGTVVATIRNDGDAPIAASVHVLWFEDRDRSGDYNPTFDALLAESIVPPMEATVRTTVSQAVDGDLSFSGAPILAFVDASDVVREVSESNNVESSATPPVAPGCTSEAFSVTRHDNIYDIAEEGNWNIDSGGTAIVAHLTDDTGDGIYDERDDPTILFWGQGLPDDPRRGNLVLLRGTTGEVLAILGDQDGGNSCVRAWIPQGIAVANVDEDPAPEIVVTGSFVTTGTPGTRFVVLDNHLRCKWIGDVLPPRGTTPFGGYYLGDASILIANLDGRGAPELIMGAYVCDNHGHLLATPPSGGSWGTPGSVPGYDDGGNFQSAVADIDGDGDLELIAGATVYSFDGHALHVERQDEGIDGWVGVANFDDDPSDAEIVVASRDGLRLYDAPPLPPAGPGGLVPMWSSPWHPPSGMGGASDWAWTSNTSGFSGTAAKDFDGDGIAEILIGAGQAIGAIKTTDGSTASDATRVMWMYQTGYGRPATPTAFDLDGDGTLEVLHEDGAEFRILNIGSTVTRVYVHPRAHYIANVLEVPTVADIDNDGHADVLVTSSNRWWVDYGLWVFSDPSWMPARSTWNQTPYAVTNVNDDGSIPRHPVSNWRAPAGAPSNDYKCQHAPNGTARCLALPDVTVSQVTASADPCGETTDLHAVVGNGGAASIATVEVSFFPGDPGETDALGSVEVGPLAPGESTTASFETDEPIFELHVVADTGDITEVSTANNACHAPVGRDCALEFTRRATVLTIQEGSGLTGNFHDAFELSAVLTDEATSDPARRLRRFRARCGGVRSAH